MVIFKHMEKFLFLRPVGCVNNIMIELHQDSDSVITTSMRKTRKGWVGFKIKNVHLRDVPCGFELCPQEQHRSLGIFLIDQYSQAKIYILDTYTLLNQADVIYNSKELNNLIILQSSIENLSADKSKYNGFKNFMQNNHIDSGRYIYLLADTYHKEIRNLLGEAGQEVLLKTTLKWYRAHLEDCGFKKLSFNVLSSDQKLLINNKDDSSFVSLFAFLKENNSNLLEYLRFKDSVYMNTTKWQQHFEEKEALQGLRKGQLFRGKYMNQKSYLILNNTTYNATFINNRAMFGDSVFVRLFPREQWVNKAACLKQQDGLEGKESNFSAERTKEEISLVKYLEDNRYIVPVAEIVFIARNSKKMFCGTVNEGLKVNRSAQMKDEREDEVQFQIYQFVPADVRYPNFYIRTFNFDTLRGKRIVVYNDGWPATSTLPICHYVRTVGDVGDLKTEEDVILLEHDVEIREFSNQAYACLPPAGQHFSIPATEEAIREDLRALDVVSIDPPGCKDIDDAIHCLELANGNLEIGVHIADVSYYVRPDSALDLEARNRCTTVYLIDRRTDMLPKLLTQNLCSLRAQVDRLAFSTIWEIEPETAKIVKTRYSKSIIRSRRAFTYLQAQQLMDSQNQSAIALSIRNLNRVAKKLKSKRNDKGALTLASTQVKIKMSEQTSSATDVQMYQMVQANFLIQQFMLLANISVAQKVYERFPSISILRRHIQPKASELLLLKQIMQSYGYEFNYSTSKELADSLNKISRQGDDFFNKLVRIMTTRCMNEATYFCSADFDTQEFYHYGLAVPFYTHFTSPIRRYADILVHRLLSAALDLEPLPSFMINKLKMTKICDNMNMRNRMARYASRASSDYHTYQFFKDKQGIEQGIVTSIADNSVTIMLAKYGLESQIMLAQQQINSLAQLNKSLGFLTKVKIRGQLIISLFDYVNIRVEIAMEGFHKQMKFFIM